MYDIVWEILIKLHNLNLKSTEVRLNAIPFKIRYLLFCSYLLSVYGIYILTKSTAKRLLSIYEKGSGQYKARIRITRMTLTGVSLCVYGI